MPRRVSCPWFVGRTAELGTLTAALDEVLGGACRTVLIGGDAGIGKSRLASEVGARATTAGAEVLVGACMDLADGGAPYAAINEVLARLGRSVSSRGRRSVRRAARCDPAADRGAPGGARARGRALVGSFDAGPPRAPRTWAGRSPPARAGHLPQRRRPPARAPVATDARRAGPLRPRRARPARRAGAGGSARPARGHLRRTARRGHGPRRAGALGRHPVARRGARCGGEQRRPGVDRPARAAAVAVRSVVSPDPGRASGRRGRWPARRAPPARRRRARRPSRSSTAALREAVSSHILLVDGDHYLFRHALLHSAIADDALPGERARLHDAFATAIERGPALVDGERHAALVHHWSGAGRPGPALRAAVEAAARAEAAYARPEAQRFWEVALAAWDDAVGELGADEVPITHDELLHRAADNASRAGDVERAAELVEIALASVDPRAEPIPCRAAPRAPWLVPAPGRTRRRRIGGLRARRRAGAGAPADRGPRPGAGGLRRRPPPRR